MQLSKTLVRPLLELCAHNIGLHTIGRRDCSGENPKTIHQDIDWIKTELLDRLCWFSCNGETERDTIDLYSIMRGVKGIDIKIFFPIVVVSKPNGQRFMQFGEHLRKDIFTQSVVSVRDCSLKGLWKQKLSKYLRN